MKSPKRIRRDPEIARAQILDAAKQIMLDEGYAAVGTRRVAEVAGVSVTLVYYYFPTVDDLFLALYRYLIDVKHVKLEEASASADPLSALWHEQIDPARGALGAEFLALANHRKVIRSEIVRYQRKARAQQAKRLARVLEEVHVGAIPCPPICLVTLIVSVARTLIMEDGIGVSIGHKETRAFVEALLAQWRNDAAARGRSAAR